MQTEQTNECGILHEIKAGSSRLKAVPRWARKGRAAGYTAPPTIPS